jgi:hypothetical protein
MIELSMNMEQYDCPFIDTTADDDVTFSAVYWDFDRRTRELETRMVVEGEDRGALTNGMDTLRAHGNMNDFTLVARRDNVAQIDLPGPADLRRDAGARRTCPDRRAVLRPPAHL